ncbi:MAG TPA: hypothetical protein DCS82_12755 [Rhodospirillaceae bacterium]|nr:hypothetical protein [Rhodospirillaceae bacterium]HAA90868.1 hypothetical protein [Rhodospirillaceae bacterium]HAT36576.1 hypothetical protein [Rhodospirillaceae bacterium]|tara:strand:+ start:395 stop:733 length:339 start_codon:yes stop_codon:yes gene_type:complete
MDFRDLDALHAAHDLAIEIHDVSQSFPGDNQFTLGESICTTALEIPASLAEGCGRGSDEDMHNAIVQAKGLAQRLEYLILLAGQLGMIDEETLGDMTELLDALKSQLEKAPG